MLYKLQLCFLLILRVKVYSIDLEDTELVMTFLTHRHGDRTPVQLPSSMIKNNPLESNCDVINTYGYGQLTEAGIRRGYGVGKFIRQRYAGLLSARYNFSEIHIRSTDSTRTKKTVLAAMAAVYSPEAEKWSDDINWVPVPYTTVPINYDHLLATLNCPTFIESFVSIFKSSNIPELLQYEDVYDELAEEIGFDLRTVPMAIVMLEDYYTSLEGLGKTIDASVTKIMPKIREITNIAMNIIWGNENNLHLQAGVSLKEFYDAATLAITGKKTPKVIVYSAHDFNVYSMMAVSRVPLSAPKYGAIFALELRKVLSTEQYVILAVYKSTPESETEYLQVDGCKDLLCDFGEFSRATSRYAISLKDWKIECKWDEDAEIDASSIA